MLSANQVFPLKVTPQSVQLPGGHIAHCCYKKKTVCLISRVFPSFLCKLSNSGPPDNFWFSSNFVQGWLTIYQPDEILCFYPSAVLIYSCTPVGNGIKPVTLDHIDPAHISNKVLMLHGTTCPHPLFSSHAN